MGGLRQSVRRTAGGSLLQENQMHPSTKVSDNVTYGELIKSPTALRHNIDNTPNEDQLENLIYLVLRVVQPCREHFGKPVTINSAFRCLDLNRLIGSSDTSQHTKGEAIDFEILGVSNYDLAKYIEDNLEFDQLILEFYTGEDSSGWVHVSLKATGHNRNQSLTINKNGVKRGLLKNG